MSEKITAGARVDKRSKLRAKYIVERCEFGWIVKAPEGERGIPLDSFTEIANYAPRGAVMASFVNQFYGCITGICMPKDVQPWKDAIEAHLLETERHPGRRWLRGTDVGMSALAIFIALIDGYQLCYEALDGRTMNDFAVYTPSDADDFGRCHRLLLRTPPWEKELDKVAKAYPGSRWEKIIPAWPELVDLFMKDKAALGKRLEELNA